jgi:hypothetical protein
MLFYKRTITIVSELCGCYTDYNVADKIRKRLNKIYTQSITLTIQCWILITKKENQQRKENNMKAFDKEWNMRVMLCVENIKILESQDDMTDDEEDRWNFWKQELNNLLFGYI